MASLNFDGATLVKDLVQLSPADQEQAWLIIAQADAASGQGVDRRAMDFVSLDRLRCACSAHVAKFTVRSPNTWHYMVNGTNFELSVRYVVFEFIGYGAFGMTCAVQDNVTNERIAIKKIENAFDDYACTKQTLRELRILRQLRHENLIEVKGMFVHGQEEDFQDVYICSELMDTDLASILRSSQPLTDDHCQFFLYQLFRGIKYIHSALVTHCDLKPRSLLVNTTCDLKISDFGRARSSIGDAMLYMDCTRLYTRWYRAPEFLVDCCSRHLTNAVDIWSIGCIFAEIIGRKPFFPGCNTQHQLQLIINIIGVPQMEELCKIQNDKCRRFIRALSATATASLEEEFPDASPAALHLLDMTLQFDPDRRVMATEALQHTYLDKLSCPEDEPVRTPLDSSDFDFERRVCSVEDLRKELFHEATKHYPVRKRQRV